MPVPLSADDRQRAITDLRAWFRDEREEDIGDLQASFVLDAVLKTVAAPIYNRAIRDAKRHLLGLVDDLDVTLYERES